MRWKYLVLILISAFLMFSIADQVLAGMGGGPMGGQQMGPGHGKALDMMEQGKSLRAGQGMHGLGFMHSAGNAYGQYVTFTIDNQTGNILNYGIEGNPLFNISIANFNNISTATLGSITRISNADGSIVIQIHDNPAAVINLLTNKSTSVTFTLADSVNAAKEDNFIRIESGSIVGYILGMGTVTSSVSATQVKMDASPNSAVVFRAAPVNMPMFGQMHKRLSQEIARNRVGMEVAFGRNGTYDFINYTAGMHLKVQTMDRDRIRLLVNATNLTGRIIAINLDNSSLAIGPSDRLRIRYDEQLIQCMDDPNVVFNGTDTPLCWLSPIQDRARVQLMIYAPKFSEHAIDILVEPEVTGTPTANATTGVPAGTPGAPGFGLMISLAGLLTWAFLAMRRKK